MLTKDDMLAGVERLYKMRAIAEDFTDTDEPGPLDIKVLHKCEAYMIAIFAILAEVESMEQRWMTPGEEP